MEFVFLAGILLFLWGMATWAFKGISAAYPWMLGGWAAMMLAHIAMKVH